MEGEKKAEKEEEGEMVFGRGCSGEKVGHSEQRWRLAANLRMPPAKEV